MEETILALLTMYGMDTGIKTERFFDISKLVMELAGVAQPSNRPVVGASGQLSANRLSQGLSAAA